MVGSLRMFLVAATTLIMFHVCNSIDSYKILFFTLHGSSSHFDTFRPAMEALSLRGHNVSYLSALPVTMQPTYTKIPNVTIYFMESLHRFIESQTPNIFNMNFKLTNNSHLFKITRILNFDACRVFLNDSAFRAVVEDKSSDRYDVIIIDPLLSTCGLSLLDLLGHPPFIYYCTSHLYPWTATSLDIPTPLSYVPMISFRTLDLRYLTERLKNAHDFYTFDLFHTYFLMSAVLKVVQSVYPTMPSLRDMEVNASFVFTNSHSASFDSRRPLTNYFAEVGGTHLRPAKPIPRDLEEFVNGSGKNGFIYMSFGAYNLGTGMSVDRVNEFVGAFRKLKQRVVWKTGLLNITNLPPNVRIFPWLPQQDLLGHPRIKAFISHCGQLSVQEALYHAVPIVGMPIIGDQFINIKNAYERGIGEELDYITFDQGMLYKTLTNIIGNSSYKNSCLRESALIRDRPSRAIDTITYWVEYVARHKGAPNLRKKHHQPPESFFQFLSFDVAVAAILLFAVAYNLTLFVLRNMLLAICSIIALYYIIYYIAYCLSVQNMLPPIL